jgi:hypothetical protein
MCPPGRPAKRDTAIERSRWPALYGIVAFGLAALAVTEVVAGAVVRPALESVVGAVAFVAVVLWVRGNRAALDQQAWCECAAETLTVRVIPSRRPERLRPTVPRAPAALPVRDGEPARELVLTS